MKIHSALLLSLILSACGQAEDRGSKSAEAESPVGSIVAHVAGLTPSYLEGQWCFTHMRGGGNKINEMANYIFSKDGTLLYQINSTSAIEEKGSYVIESNDIKIIPTLSSFNLQLESMTPDKFVLKMAAGQLHWSRGTCKEQAL